MKYKSVTAVLFITIIFACGEKEGPSDHVMDLPYSFIDGFETNDDNINALFPENEWVTVKWQMTLSPDHTGQNILSINDQEVINESGKNMPNASDFKNEFTANDIDFTLPTPVHYERIQIGATANPTQNNYIVNVDNFRLSIVE